jgi:hypothetical protein
LSEVDYRAAWTVGLICLGAIWAVVFAAMYQIIQTMETEHEFEIDEEEHVKEFEYSH